MVKIFFYHYNSSFNDIYFRHSNYVTISNIFSFLMNLRTVIGKSPSASFIISKVLHIQILIVITKLLHKIRYTNDTSNKFSLFTLQATENTPHWLPIIIYKFNYPPEIFKSSQKNNTPNHRNSVLTEVYMETLKKIHSHLNILYKISIHLDINEAGFYI